MSFSYTVRESFSGFTRAKVSFVVSVLTICISLILLGLFALVSMNATRFIEGLRNRIELEAFLQEPLTRDELSTLQQAVEGIDGVRSVTFISKDEAARIFKQEFGEDINQVLDFNPLPPSFKITLREGYRTALRVRAIHDRLVALKGIESVVYRRTLLELIDQRTEAIHNIMLGLGVLISLSAVFLVSNTIRLAIYAKRKLIRTMELVGATRAFIRLPFLLEGMIQGVLGGALAAALLYGLLEYAVRLLSVEVAVYVHMDPTFYFLMIAAGAALGLIGSVISILRFIRTAEAA